MIVYREETVGAALWKAAKAARAKADRQGFKFTYWRVGVEFTQPADDGRTYLSKALEVRTSERVRWTEPGRPHNLRDWCGEFSRRFFTQEGYADQSRARNPLLHSLVIEAFGGFQVDRAKPKKRKRAKRARAKRRVRH